MNTIDRKHTARQARMAWRQQKTQREIARRRAATPFNGLEVPGFSAGQIVDAADNTLNKDVIAAGNGLQVEIPGWPNLPPAGFSDALYLECGEGPDPAEEDFVAVALLSVPGPAPTFPIVITLPDANLQQEGPFKVRYRVTTWNETTDWSAAVALIVDTTPPRGNADPDKVTVPVEAITDEYLAAHPAGVECGVPAYPDWKAGDRVAYWWLNELPEVPTDLPPIAIVEVTDQPQQITVPAAVVTAMGDGGCYVIYALIDKATNRSRLSVYTRLAVALGTLPDNLQDPLVPQADDGSVDLKDAFDGVVVAIPAFDHWKPTDRIEVTWGSTRLMEEPIGSAPGFPVQVRVPNEVLRAEYAGAEGAVATEISYRILRGDVPFGPQQITVDVDLSVIGPVLPEWPDPVNPGLSVATVYGSGEDAPPNELLRDVDTGKPATLTFQLYTPLAAGEQVDFYWGGVRVVEARYIVQDEDAPGQDVTAQIPWSYIEQMGNDPSVPVHYRISAPDSPNEQHSPMTSVNVTAVVITPPAPQFLKLSANGLLNCSSLDGEDHAVLVQVPDLSAYLVAGDEVTVTWTPLAGMSGEDLLDEAIKEESISLDADTVTGFVWRVQPYETHILPTYDPEGAGNAGRARIKYSFTYKGELATSVTEERIVAMFTAGSSCPL
jgi:hypothetical protein